MMYLEALDFGKLLEVIACSAETNVNSLVSISVIATSALTIMRWK